ncbi:MAG: hypothetical protein LBQ12_15465 [Deltaproteobacteria bacterium]|jgi:hypothetical protein|nr:hypothetical protein [Deltaproteobacteria bacterium]
MEAERAFAREIVRICLAGLAEAGTPTPVLDGVAWTRPRSGLWRGGRNTLAAAGPGKAREKPGKIGKPVKPGEPGPTGGAGETEGTGSRTARPDTLCLAPYPAPSGAREAPPCPSPDEFKRRLGEAEGPAGPGTGSQETLAARSELGGTLRDTGDARLEKEALWLLREASPGLDASSGSRDPSPLAAKARRARRLLGINGPAAAIPRFGPEIPQADLSFAADLLRGGQLAEAFRAPERRRSPGHAARELAVAARLIRARILIGLVRPQDAACGDEPAIDAERLPEPPGEARHLADAAACFRQDGDRPEEMNPLRHSLMLRRLFPGGIHPETAASLSLAGEFAAGSSFGEGLPFLALALETLSDAGETFGPDRAEPTMRLGHMLSRSGEWERGTAIFRKAQDWAAGARGRADPLAYAARLELTDALLGSGDLAGATEASRPDWMAMKDSLPEDAPAESREALAAEERLFSEGVEADCGGPEALDGSCPPRGRNGDPDYADLPWDDEEWEWDSGDEDRGDWSRDRDGEDRDRGDWRLDRDGGGLARSDEDQGRDGGDRDRDGGGIHGKEADRHWDGGEGDWRPPAARRDGSDWTPGRRPSPRRGAPPATSAGQGHIRDHGETGGSDGERDGPFFPPCAAFFASVELTLLVAVPACAATKMPGGGSRSGKRPPWWATAGKKVKPRPPASRNPKPKSSLP